MDKNLDSLAVIFDLDGTLIDTAGDLAAAMNHVLAIEGRSIIDPEDVRHLVGFGAKAMITKGFQLNDPSFDPEKAPMDRYFQNFIGFYEANIAENSQPFPHALGAIDAIIASGAKVAICTNKPEAPARLLIDQLELNDKFSVIVGGDTAPAAKPDARPVELCFSLLNLGRGIFVGDSDTDILAAKAAGIPCLLHENGYGPVTQLDDIFASFGCYANFPKLVEDASRFL